MRARLAIALLAIVASSAPCAAGLDLRHLRVPVATFQDDAGPASSKYAAQLITNGVAYSRAFGHRARGIDFSREWVIFFNAGPQQSPARVAIWSATFDMRSRVLSVELSITDLGACAPADAPFKPYVLGKIRRLGGLRAPVAFRIAHVVVDCFFECVADSDCRLVPDTCTGCDCRSLAPHQPDPTCDGPGVECFADPCQFYAPVCRNGFCALER